jgi:hypothetical protein
MDEILTYRGKTITRKDVTFIRTLIKDNPRDSRRSLSQKLCWQWDWRQPNGALCDMVCRSLMLELHRAGHIRLPAKKHNPPNPLAHRQKPPKATIDHIPLEEPLSRVLGPGKTCSLYRHFIGSTAYWMPGPFYRLVGRDTPSKPPPDGL